MATRMPLRRRTLHRVGAFRILRERGDTEYLLSDPENARRLLAALERARAGKGRRIESINEFRRSLGI